MILCVGSQLAVVSQFSALSDSAAMFFRSMTAMEVFEEPGNLLEEAATEVSAEIAGCARC